MPEIPSIGSNSVGPIGRPAGAVPYLVTPKLKAATATQNDRVELSDHAMLLDRLRRLPDARSDLVDAVRKAISDGSYETPEKLGVAVDRLLDDLRA